MPVLCARGCGQRTSHGREPFASYVFLATQQGARTKRLDAAYSNIRCSQSQLVAYAVSTNERLNVPTNLTLESVRSSGSRAWLLSSATVALGAKQTPLFVYRKRLGAHADGYFSQINKPSCDPAIDKNGAVSVVAS